jgi:hypothetical protein
MQIFDESQGEARAPAAVEAVDAKEAFEKAGVFDHLGGAN